jgi:hypothetical protein
MQTGMKLLVLAIILISLYLIYRLSFPGKTGNRQGDEAPPPKPPDAYEAVIKSRFVLPDQSNTVKRKDKKENSGKEDEKADIFAAGNDNPNIAAVPSEELDGVFGEDVNSEDEDVNPEDLDIEPDEDGEPETEFAPGQPDAEEEAEEICRSAGEIEGYADGFTYDELATVIYSADKQPDTMTQAAVTTLRNLAQTDMFEKLVSSDADRAARIASVLDRSEQSLAGQGKGPADDSDTEYRNFDIGQFLEIN